MSTFRGTQRIDRHKLISRPVVYSSLTPSTPTWSGEVILNLAIAQDCEGTDRGVVARTFTLTRAVVGTDRGVVATTYTTTFSPIPSLHTGLGVSASTYTTTIGPVPALHTGIGFIALTETISRAVMGTDRGVIDRTFAVSRAVVGTDRGVLASTYTVTAAVAGAYRGAVASTYTTAFAPIPSLHTATGAISLSGTISRDVIGNRVHSSAISLPLFLIGSQQNSSYYANSYFAGSFLGGMPPQDINTSGTAEKTPWPLVTIPSGFVRYG